MTNLENARNEIVTILKNEGRIELANHVKAKNEDTLIVEHLEYAEPHEIAYTLISVSN